MPPLSRRVWKKLRTDFEPSIQPEIAEILNLYGDSERERVQLYILQLAKGNQREVVGLVEEANQDYRNIIFRAENPEESQIDPVVIKRMINEFGESNK